MNKSTMLFLGDEGHAMGGSACCCDCRHLGTCEFPDDSHFCALEAMLMQIGAREVALPKLMPAGSGKAAGSENAEDNQGEHVFQGLPVLLAVLLC
jgi:hypothetical protein